MILNRQIVKTLVIIFTICILFTGCGSEPSNEQTAQEVEITISAAASLTDALQEIQDNYEAEHTGVSILYNFGASGSLRQQIEQGAPADIFVSASQSDMKQLVDQGYIKEDQQTTLLTNELTVITGASEAAVIQDADDLLSADIHHIAIGIPETVPAGKYAKEALQNANVWDKLESKFVQAKDVRQVLQYVETGNVDAGIVYRTDALSSEKVNIAYTIDSSSYTPIEYPVGMISSDESSKEANDFYEYLQSKEALSVFQKYGFSLPGSK